MRQTELETYISRFPIYQYQFFSPLLLTFSDKVRTICEQECDRFGTTWACPPAVGSVEECKKRCMAFSKALFFSTVSDVEDFMDMEALLKTRMEHEAIVEEIEQFIISNGVSCYTLSTESCEICDTCAYPEEPCRFPKRMHPCVESHGILVTQLAEQLHMDYSLEMNAILWFGIIFMNGVINQTDDSI